MPSYHFTVNCRTTWVNRASTNSPKKAIFHCLCISPRPQNALLRVEWDVKLYTLTPIILVSDGQLQIFLATASSLFIYRLL